jgi:EmrB/QacA subfamily drug resistance transporter
MGRRSPGLRALSSRVPAKRGRDPAGIRRSGTDVPPSARLQPLAHASGAAAGTSTSLPPAGPARAGPIRAPGRGRGAALVAVCAVLFLTFLDTTIVSVALADVQARLHAGVTQLQWVVNGYALTFASLMLMAGSLSDRFGRRKTMLVGLAVFATGSLVCALATNPDMLVAGRVVMGAGAAGSEPATLSVIRHLYPEEESRTRALGAWTAVSGLALALGPVVGGVLVGIGTWRAIFWFNVAACVVVIGATARTLPESADPQNARLDLPGFFTGAIGLASLTFAVILGETDGYRASAVVVLFVVGVVALVGFVHAEHRSRAPMLDLGYFRDPRFSGAIVVGFVVFFSIFSIFFFTALYLAAVVGYSPDRIALEFAPMSAAMIAAAALAGRRVASIGPRSPMAQGCVLAGAGILLSAVLLDAARPSAWLTATLALTGFGFGTAVVPVTSVALAEVPPEHSGMAASATNTSRELGSVFGVAVLGALVNAHLTADLTRRLHELRIPANFISIVINAIETGSVPRGVRGGGSIEDRVIEAAYGAFRSGLETALIAAGLAMLCAALLAAATLSTRRDASTLQGGGTASKR